MQSTISDQQEVNMSQISASNIRLNEESQCHRQQDEQSQAEWNYGLKSANPSIPETSLSLFKKQKKLNSKQIQQTILFLKSKMPRKSTEQIIRNMRARLQTLNPSSQTSDQYDYTQDKYLNKIVNFKNKQKPNNNFKILRKKQGKLKFSYRAIRQRQRQQQRQLIQQIQKQQQHFQQNQFNQCKKQVIQQDSFNSHQQPHAKILLLNGLQNESTQKIIMYSQASTKPSSFINIQEEKRYNELKLMAKTFIQRGYGVSHYRKEIYQQGLSMIIHKDKYKNMATALMILAFRRLELFIQKECNKIIKKLNRCQARRISYILLRVKDELQQEHYKTFFKYIRIGFQLGDVQLGQKQSTKLYLAIMRFIHGKSITMFDLQRIGDIDIKKQKQVALDYLNRRRKKRLQKANKTKMCRQLYRQTIISNNGEQLLNNCELQYINDQEIIKVQSSEFYCTDLMAITRKSETQQISISKIDQLNVIKQRLIKEGLPIVPSSFLQSFIYKQFPNPKKVKKTNGKPLQFILYNQNTKQLSLSTREN